MAGKRLLDAARLFSATRNIAGQHFKIRSEQLETWNKTSTVAKAVKNQTDRVTLTLQAASALAQRFNEERPSYTAQSTATRDEEPVPRQGTVAQKMGDVTVRQGLQQDHHYRREEENTMSETAKHEDLGVQQEKSATYPTADGTIPSRDAPVDSALPASQLEPESDSIPKQEAVPKQGEDFPGGINTDIFHSPRVAELLGQKKKDGRAKQDMRMQGARNTPIDRTGLHKGKYQDTFNVRESAPAASAASSEAVEKMNTSINTPTQSSESPEDMQSLAAELSKCATAPDAYSEVSNPIELH